MSADTAEPQPKDSAAPALLAVILLLTAAVILFWGHARLLDQDEVFVLHTDSVASIGKLIEVQRHTPISLDPLFYHLLGHVSTTLFGATAFGIRLPSLFGFLLFQICLFAIAKRIAGSRAGVIAAGVPALTATLFYGVQARPYGVLLGLAGLVLLAWQHSTRDDASHRTPWLIALAIGIALALNTHYFAVLLMIPLCTAELVRIARDRRIDWPVVTAIIVGMAGVAFALPFQKAAGEYRKHYYNGGRVDLHAVTQAYRSLFVAYTRYSMRIQHILMAVLVIFAIALIAAIILRFRSSDISLPTAERVFLIVLAALPFFGFLLAKFVTHSIEVRYVLCAILAIAVFIAIALLPILRSKQYPAIVAALLVLIIGAGVLRIHEESARSADKLASLTISPQVREALLANTQPIYVQNVGNFDESIAYLADPALQHRFALVYSFDNEIKLAHHDTNALTAEHMQHFTAFPIDTYEHLKQQPGAHLMLLYHGGGWNWIDTALAQDHAQITPVGPALQGDVVSVVFP